ncbi:hypothetical protein CC86DRAFT_130915 [Ophiobolus disseminans]|uniref:Frequency clock protein n=1 Tax=Ophiobolus disseminans TaxID=1469910 RepID=A0A6A6ZGZ2_9PLEO|nr:hypothetical protein CC86DRAFT_130915 [Ophiobolus disseminans]
MATPNGPPATMPQTSVGHHPRRPPAYKSVSLRHSPPAPSQVGLEHQSMTSSSTYSASDKANPPSLSSKLLLNKYSSGESSDAGKWFETTNNNAQQSGASFADNEPPFFLRNSSSSETPPEGLSTHYAYMRPAMPYRPSGANIGPDASSAEDYRSVIDDLTIANKKLKQKLKKFEKVHDAHLQDDKLFEVRFHSLPDHKKKELEETLRKFAAGLDDGAATDYPRISSQVPALEQQKTASSTSRFAESGYASMSASGQNSSAQSNQTSNQADDNRKMSRSAYNRQQQSIQSYLHDIPAGLLSDNSVPLSDKAKKKLVVRRLEQIFAGKRSVPGSHPHPVQQEEVAQSAATADREEREATGWSFRPEGLRVARIHSNRGGKILAPGHPEALPKLRPNLHVGGQDSRGSVSPDQRPTRPLDLDPSRAQVPVENMDYFRHLGFTPPNMATGEAPEDGHGWLYLNLLINMAQLHTLNVTPEFVKDALTDYSGHLELSSDGRKVRWSGGLDVTRQSNDSSSDLDSSNSPNEHGSPLKRSEADVSAGNEATKITPEQRALKLARAQREKELNRFTYTPMFFRKMSEEEDEGYAFENESSETSFLLPQHPGNSSGPGNSAIHSGSPTKRKQEHGPMIFYTKARFCTDLSGDRLGSSATALGAYNSATSFPIGAKAHSHVSSRLGSDLGEPRGPMDLSPMETDSNSGSRTTPSDESPGFFSPAALMDDFGNNSPAEIADFEASGLGGVQPDDNFSIRVRRSQTQTAPSRLAGRRRSCLLPKKILDALGERSTPDLVSKYPAKPQRVIKQEIISTSHKSLPTSSLPPASFLPFDSTSSGDVDSDLDSEASSDISSSGDSSTGNGPGTALQLLNVSPIPDHQLAGSDSDAADDSDDFDDSDDGSVDLLATARELDPHMVRNQEREYDAAIAERLAEEIVAGSSAATAGGGSGFNTPADGMLGARAKRLSSTSGSADARAVLKRSRTSDSVATKKAVKSRKTRE